jgi:hypothetical protein
MTAIHSGVGLHVGDSEICVALPQGDGMISVFRQPALFSLVRQEAVHGTKWANLGTRYKGERLLFGESARQAQDLGQVKENMSGCGRHDIHRLAAEFALASILAETLGPASAPAQPCVYSVPSQLITQSQEPVLQLIVLKDLVRKLGYMPHPLEEGKALVVAEVRDTDVNLLAFSFGAYHVHCCLSCRGIVGIDFSFEPGGDWVDDQVAAVLEVDRDKARQIRENCRSLRVPRSREEEVLAVFIRKFVDTIFDNLVEIFKKQGPPLLVEPVDVIWAGEWLAPEDFGDLFLSRADRLGFPLHLGSIRRPGEPETVAARGCLQLALALSEARHFEHGAQV